MKTVLTSFIEHTCINHAALHERVTAASVTYNGYSKSEAEKQIPTLASRIYSAGQVLSLVWQRSKQTYYVLLPQGTSLQLDDAAVSVKPQGLDLLPKWVITSLLIRATPRLLGSQENHPDRLEADGLHYVVDRKPLKGTGSVITTVNIDSIWCEPAKTARLIVRTVTFTPLRAHEKPDGELPRKIANQPRYRLDTLGQNIVRDGSGDYVKRTLWRNTKNRVPAFRLNGLVTLESYYRTRLGVISLFLDDLKRAYGEAFSITLKEIQPTVHVPVSGASITKSYESLFDLMRQQPIWITNHSDDPDASARLQALLLPHKVQSELSSTIRPDGLNILLVNDKDRYKDGQPDPYKEARRHHPDTIIQSCYPDRLKLNSAHVVQVLLKELFIKSEVQQRKLLLDYPALPYDAVFITSVRPLDEENVNKIPWPMYYCKVEGERLCLGPLPQSMADALKENLTQPQHKAAFTGAERADLIFWPESGDALTITDTEALTLPDEPTTYNIVKELDQTAVWGVPCQLISEYCEQHASRSIVPELKPILAEHGETVPAKAFRSFTYKSHDSKHFFDYLSNRGYRLKASMQSKNAGPLSSTAGIWIDKSHALYSVGNPDSAQRNQDNFNHIYCVEDNGLEVPEWFWASLAVWHVKHRGATVYPYIFKHLREYAIREALKIPTLNPPPTP
tara:strand:+ start:1281 stop:3311 length:2031 start_codon:yes stop_codon:yes gene_type:complete